MCKDLKEKKKEKTAEFFIFARRCHDVGGMYVWVMKFFLSNG